MAERRRRERLRYHEVAALDGRASAWRTSSSSAARHVRRLLEDGAELEELAERAGLNPETVRRVLRGHRVLSSTARALESL